MSSVFLDNTLQNASYTSHSIQKEILQILANKIRSVIREEIGRLKFYIIVNEVREESKKEQMTIVLRFVDKAGFMRKYFFDLVYVSDTTSLTLKKNIFSVFFLTQSQCTRYQWLRI